ncbi:MAG: hypothetical protein ACK52I_23305 [Pseudomonadota bacterium]
MDVILIRDGVVQNVISADSVERALMFYPEFTAMERTADISFVGPGYLYDGVTFTAPPPPEPEPVTDWRVTKLRFQLRFTDAEAIAIDLASQGATVEAAAVRRYLKLIELAEWIDLANQLVRNGIFNLAAAGLLTEERANVIIDTPPTDDEKAA